MYFPFNYVRGTDELFHDIASISSVYTHQRISSKYIFFHQMAKSTSIFYDKGNWPSPLTSLTEIQTNHIKDISILFQRLYKQNSDISKLPHLWEHIGYVVVGTVQDYKLP